jgi:UPF0716 protein FxsA
MFVWLALLFVTVPLIELGLLVWLGGQVGLLPTVALVVVTGILGAALARWQGLATLSRFQQRLATGELPHEDLIDGILILLAGAVLLTPGLLTDVAGFLLLVPAVRAGVRRLVLGKLKRRFMIPPVEGPVPVDRPGPRIDDQDVVDAEFTVHDG